MSECEREREREILSLLINFLHFFCIEFLGCPNTRKRRGKEACEQKGRELKMTEKKRGGRGRMWKNGEKNLKKNRDEKKKKKEKEKWLKMI